MKTLFCFALSLLLACTVCAAAAEETLPADTEAPPAVTECSHSYDAGVVTTEANCSQAGVKTFTCTLCGGTKTESIPMDPNAHSYGPWNGGQAESHSRSCGCGATQSVPHSFDVTATVPPTCKEEGATAYGCSTCGRIEYEMIPKRTTHTYDNDCDPDCNICGFLRDAAHKYSTVWSKDGVNHWHACTKCGGKADVGKHVPGPAATEEKAQLCLTCGYVLTSRRKHTHTYETEFTSDETGHWYTCTGCEERRDFEEHTFDNPCDPDCNICGWVTDTAHTPDAQWNRDETGHWHLCTECGEFFQYSAHAPGDDGQCGICGFALSPTEEAHTHSGEGDWLSDAHFHWKQCQCGEEIGKEAHIWEKSGRICTVCGGEKLAEPAESDRTFGVMPIVLAVLMILAAGACAALLLYLRKKPGKYAK